ncbi:MAG: flagellar motor protein MotB [Hyphomicrobiaceae bacterium]|nr:flagellar motor protein MotB [Hyphomicrobiaceae bacterium]
MAKKQQGGGGGAPEWLVTFADLMSLLVCFFVLIISFSIQDQQKLQVVAGSMREAFGIQTESRKAGMIEIEGAPLRDFLRQVGIISDDSDTDYAAEQQDLRTRQGPEANTHDIEMSEVEIPRQFATAAASLRQAWEELPEITELSENIIMEETEEGLNIQLIDQEGRSMFPEGSKYPFEATRLLLAAMAPVIAQMPNRIRITGHTTATPESVNPGYGAWELSADRANTARRLLGEYGIPSDRFHSVVGMADTQPLFANDPYLAANRRISILLMAEAPPVPPSHGL